MAAKTPEDRQRELAYEIGVTILAWSHAEWKLMMLLAMVLATSLDAARMVWASATSHRAKRELLMRLGEAYLIDALLPEFRDIIAKTKHLSEKRNMIAHDRAYLMKGATFRFMNDQDETQPNTFGRYRDVQIGNVRNWGKEIVALDRQIDGFMAIAMAAGRALLAQQRLLQQRDQDPDAGDGHSPANS